MIPLFAKTFGAPWPGLVSLSRLAGQALRKDHIMAWGADGQEMSGLIPNAPVGAWLDWAAIEGKMVSKSSALYGGLMGGVVVSGVLAREA
jgi:hypothetical protein